MTMTSQELKEFGELAKDGFGVKKDSNLHKLAVEVAQTGDQGKAKQLAVLVNKNQHLQLQALSGCGSKVTKIAMQLTACIDAKDAPAKVSDKTKH